MNKIAGIILAGGTSSRMGRPKQLLPVGEFSLLEMVIKEALQSGLAAIILVLGHQSEFIRRSIRSALAHHPKLRIIVNPDYQQGLSSSLITGLSLVKDEYDQVMFLLADLPFLSASIINHLMEGCPAGGNGICALKIGERRSLPVIIGRKYYPDLLRLQGDRGARDLFVHYAEKVRLIDAPEGYRDWDLDTPEDYETYLRTMASGTGDRATGKIKELTSPTRYSRLY